MRLKIFQTKVTEKTKTQVSCAITFFPKRVTFCDKVEQYCAIVQAMDKNMAYAHCMLDT